MRDRDEPEREHDLRCSVPPCSDIFCHVRASIIRPLIKAAGEAKVADLKLAVCIHKKVARLKVSVYDTSSVDIFHA
jgi:hypothetical protein